MTINLICATGEWQFGRLVHDALKHRGHEVNLYDYRVGCGVIDPKATTIVLRGEGELVPLLLSEITGRKILWTLEDPLKDGGRELVRTAADVQEVWVHFLHPATEMIMNQWYPGKPVKEVGCLACDQRVFDTGPDRPSVAGARPARSVTPETVSGLGAKDIDVLHYGCLTPRRERLLSKLRKCHGLSIVEVNDPNHRHIANLIRRSKVVLNLHAWSDLNVEIRLAEALSCNALVVSESLPTWALPAMVLKPNQLIALATSGDHVELAKQIDLGVQHHDRISTHLKVELAKLAPEFSHLKLGHAIEEALECPDPAATPS